MSKKTATANANAKKTNIINDMGGNYSDPKKNLKDIKMKLQNNRTPQVIQEAFRQLSEICNRETELAEAFNLRGSCYYLMGDF